MRMLVFLHDGVVRLVVDGQTEIREVDQHRLERSVPDGKVVEPAGDRRADAAGAGAADDRVKLEWHADVSCSVSAETRSASIPAPARRRDLRGWPEIRVEIGRAPV